MADLREGFGANAGNARNLDPASRTDATALPLPCVYRTGSNYRPLLDLRRFRRPVEAILINDFACLPFHGMAPLAVASGLLARRIATNIAKLPRSSVPRFSCTVV